MPGTWPATAKRLQRLIAPGMTTSRRHSTNKAQPWTLRTKCRAAFRFTPTTSRLSVMRARPRTVTRTRTSVARLAAHYQTCMLACIEFLRWYEARGSGGLSLASWKASSRCRRQRLQSSEAAAGLPWGTALGTALVDDESVEGPDEMSRRASGAVVGGLAGEGADVRLEAWECLAEAFEVARDLEGAIYAYERLLALEPSTTPGLSPTTSAKRGVQELVLLSHRQGLEATLALGRGLQEATDRSVADVVNRGLEDVETLRTVVRRDLDVVEERVRSRSPSRLERLLLGAFQPTAKALNDLQLMRRIAESDLNRLQRTLLLGDPLLAFLRETWQRAQGKAPPPVMLDALPISSEAVLWLREQFERGVLPQDPLLVASLLEQARRDPELVIRLVGEIAAASACTADGEGAPEECGLPGELPDSSKR